MKMFISTGRENVLDKNQATISNFFRRSLCNHLVRITSTFNFVCMQISDDKVDCDVCGKKVYPFNMSRHQNGKSCIMLVCPQCDKVRC